MASGVRLAAALALPVLAASVSLAACGPQGPPVAVEANHPMRTWIEAGSATPRPYVSPFEAVAGCPKTLERPEAVDRVIERGCGPVRVTAEYRLDAGSLTIEPGARLEFDAGAGLFVGFQKPARLEIRGEAGAPVVLTAADPQPKAGAWEGLRLFKGAEGSSLEHVEIEFAGHRERSALYVAAPEVSVEHTRLRASAGTAVHVHGDGWLSRYRANTLSELSSPVAMLITPDSAAGFAGENSFPVGARIHVLKGFFRRRGRWGNPGVPFIITGVIDVAGDEDRAAVLEFEAGVELRFKENAYINVGYYHPGELIAVGRVDAPITFTSAGGEESGAWMGIKLWKRAVARFDHVVFERGGRELDRGVLFANGGARLSIVHSTFRGNRAGAVLYGRDLYLEAFENNTFADNERALVISPSNLERVDTSNLFEGGRVEVKAGSITRDTRWRALEVPVELMGDILVTSGATLTIEAGARLQVRDGFHLDVGEELGTLARVREDEDEDEALDVSGALMMNGTPERPITMTGVVEDRRGTWSSIVIHGTARSSTIKHVNFANAGGNAAVEVLAGASAQLSHVSCARCVNPTLKWSCNANVRTEGLLALEGPPAAFESPTCSTGTSSRSLERIGPQ